MEREGVVCLRRAWHFGKAQEKGRALGIRMDCLFTYHVLIKSLSFVVHKSLILRSKWSGILKFRGVVRCEWNIFSNFAL